MIESIVIIAVLKSIYTGGANIVLIIRAILGRESHVSERVADSWFYMYGRTFKSALKL
jgi:hypothetical protein